MTIQLLLDVLTVQTVISLILNGIVHTLTNYGLKNNEKYLYCNN